MDGLSSGGGFMAALGCFGRLVVLVTGGVVIFRNIGRNVEVLPVGAGFVPMKAAFVMRFSSHSAAASYHSSGLSSAGLPSVMVAT